MNLYGDEKKPKKTADISSYRSTNFVIQPTNILYLSWIQKHSLLRNRVKYKKNLPKIWTNLKLSVVDENFEIISIYST